MLRIDDLELINKCSSVYLGKGDRWEYGLYWGKFGGLHYF